MINQTYRFNLKPKQSLYLVPVGDVHYGCDEHDGDRFKSLVEWAVEKKAEGHLVKFTGMGDYIEMPSPSERASLVGAKGGFGLHETTLRTFDDFFLELCHQSLKIIDPIKNDFLG